MSCLPIIHHDDLTTSDGLSGEPKAQPGPSSGSTPRRAAWAWVLQARPIYRDGSSLKLGLGSSGLEFCRLDPSLLTAVYS